MRAAAWRRPETDLPKAPAVPVSRGISAQALTARIDDFLASRGYKPPSGDAAPRAMSTPKSATGVTVSTASEKPAEFICEDDVRTAIRGGQRLLVGEKTIITPAARDLGESQKVFVQAVWPR